MKYIILLFIFSFTLAVNFFAQTTPAVGGGIVANDTSGCAPFVVEFIATTSNGISWSWDFGNGNTSTQQNPTEMYTSQGSYTISLDMVLLDGSVVHFEKTNYIEVLTTPSLGVSLSSLEACLNSNNFQFLNTTTNATQYLWDFGDGNLSSDVSPSHHYTSAGNYNLTFFATNSLGCSRDTTIANLLIHPVIQNSAQINGPSVVCDPLNVFNFNALPVGLSAYDWEFSDGSQLNGPVIQKTFNSFGAYDLLLITTDLNGCKDSSNVQDFVEITNVPDDFTVSTTSACQSTGIVFQANAVGATSVSWDFGDGNIGTGFTQNHTYQNVGQYNVTMIATRPNGCGQTITKPSFLTIVAPSTAEISISDSVACVNESISFEVVSTNAQSIQWFFGDGTSSTQSIANHHYANAGQYTVQLIYGSGGCTDTLSQVISVSQPIAGFQNNVFSNCAPVAVQFNNTSSNASSWNWTFSNGCNK